MLVTSAATHAQRFQPQAMAFLSAAGVAPRGRAAAPPCKAPRNPQTRASVAVPPHASPRATPPPSPPPQPLHVTSQAELALHTSTHPLVVLKVYSRKCRSCRRVERPFARLAHALQGRVAFLQLCAENAPEFAQGLGVRGFPTFIIWKDARRRDHFVGNSSDVIEEQVTSWL